ncbi:MAG: hypothetical protein IKV82_08495 [Akkermansia sp.]|nr:hypothetical protein [Akkermansia sp.]
MIKKEITHHISKNIAEHSTEKAKNTTGWQKWLLTAIAAIAGALAWFTQGNSEWMDSLSPSDRPDTQAPAP